MMDDPEIINLLFLAGIWGLWMVSKAKKARANAELKIDSNRSTPPNAEVSRSRRSKMPAALVEDLDARLNALRERTRVLRGDLRGVGRAAASLEEALTDAFDEPFERVSETWRVVRRELQSGATIPNLSVHIQSTSQWAAVLGGRVTAIATLATQRGCPELGTMLDDADAVARAFIAPFGDFARAHGLDFPRQDPICVPADESHEALMPELIPNHPVLMVPKNFGTDIFRWMAVPHEIAHVIWRRTPGLPQDVRSRLGLQESPRLYHSREPVSLLPRRLMSSWLPEFFADWAAVMMAGPAAVHGLSFVFNRRADPSRAAVVWVTKDGNYDEHPPGHLRMLSACALLRRMGFIIQADRLESEWRAAHPVERISVPVAGNQRVPFAAEDLASYTSAFAVAFYEAQFDTIAGYSFSSIPGFEMSFGLWAKVSRDASKLSAGTGFHDDARLVICGAVESRWHEPDNAEEIRLATRDAIVGAHAPLHDRHVSQPRRSRGTSIRFRRADFRDALVLQELAGRRRV